jgi:hypothetical protein
LGNRGKHRFLGERVFRTFSNGQTAQGIVDKYLAPDGDYEVLFYLLHLNGDKEDLDVHECFASY